MTPLIQPVERPILKNNTIAKLVTPFVLLAAFSFSAHVSAGDVVHSGEFVGKSDHITTGKVTIEKVANGYLVKLADNFSLDGAPEPSVGFGKDGEFDAKSDLGDLVSITGGQTYLIPASVDISKYNEIYIWCDKFSVPLGVAALK